MGASVPGRRIVTTPPIANHSGAAVFNQRGELLGNRRLETGEGRDLRVGEKAPGALRKITQGERADRRAVQRLHVVADRREHASHHNDIRVVLHPFSRRTDLLGNEDAVDLVIDDLCRVFRILLLVCHALEHHARFNMKDLVTQLAAHTLVHHHLACQFGCFLEVGPSASRDTIFAVDHFLGYATAQHPCQYIFIFDDAVIALVFWRDKPGHTTCSAARDNRNFMHEITIWQYVADDSMPCLVIGGQLLLELVHGLAFALWTDGNFFEGLCDYLVCDCLLILARRQDCRFVGNILQIRTGATGCFCSQGVNIYSFFEWFFLKMNLQNCFAVFTIRQTDIYPAIKTPWAQQCRVQHIGTVRRRKHDNVLALFERQIGLLMDRIETATGPVAAAAAR